MVSSTDQFFEHSGVIAAQVFLSAAKYRGRSIDGTPCWCTNLAYGPLVIHKPGEFLNGPKMAYEEVT